MRTRFLVIHLLALLMAAPAAMAGQQSEPPDAWRSLADRLSPGTFVSVRLRSGATVTGHFIQVKGDTIRINPKTRIAVPIRDVAFGDIQWIKRPKEGKSPGMKVLIGAGIGAGAILATFGIIYALIGES